MNFFYLLLVGPIINNVHTMSQQIIINSVMPPVSSISSSDFSHSELPPDLLDIALQMMDTDNNVACNSDVNCNFDGISTTSNNTEIIVTQSEMTTEKNVSANDEQSIEESVDTSTDSIVTNDKVNYLFMIYY